MSYIMTSIARTDLTAIDLAGNQMIYIAASVVVRGCLQPNGEVDLDDGTVT